MANKEKIFNIVKIVNKVLMLIVGALSAKKKK